MSPYRTLFKIGEFLFETGKALFAETDLGKLLPLAMDKVIEQTKAQRGMIVVYSPAGELLFQVARDQHRQNIAQPEAEISTTIVNQVRETGRYVVIDNALENRLADKSQSIRRLGILSVAGAPLRHEGEFLGVIYVDNRDVTAVFDDETGKLLSEFAELISVAVKNAIERRRLENETQSLKDETNRLRKEIERRRRLEELLAQSEGYDEFKGLKSLAMLEVVRRIENVAGTESSVLILGETGTGKDLVARALHQKSRRQNQAFVPLNCGAFVNPELLISALFGHVKGAYTGADKDKAGYFETADGGTIFLDEIAKSSRELQTLLLRVLETGEFNRLGENTVRRTDVRIISAANPNLPQLIERGEFLPDLYFRLAKFTIHIPPLRERREDIMEIAEYFLQKFSHEHECEMKTFDKKARELLLAYHWPGNVRDLMNAINEAVISAEGEIIYAEDLPIVLPEEAATADSEELNFQRAKQNFEREHLVKVLIITGGKVTKAAELCGMDKSNFIQKMKKHGLKADDYKKKK